jgi:hypothetical protein
MDKTRKARRLAGAKAELEQVNAAITAILSGAQQYSIGSRSVQKANLETLYKRKDSLEDLVGALEGGTGRFRRVVPVDT